MKKVLTFFLFTLISSSLYAQSSLLNYRSMAVYNCYRSEIKLALKKLSKANAGTTTISGIVNNNTDTLDNFSIYPVRRIEILLKDSLDQYPGLRFYEPEKLIVIDRSRQAVYEFSIIDSTISRVVNNSFVADCLSLTQNTAEISFFYYLEADRYRTKAAVLVLDGNKVSVNAKNQNHLNIIQYLADDCGSIKNYINAYRYEKLNAKLKSSAFDDFNPSNEKDRNNFIRNSWKFRTLSFPKDTVENLKIIVAEIGKFGNADLKQQKIISAKLKEIVTNSKIILPLKTDDGEEEVFLKKLEEVRSGKKSAGLIASDPYNQIYFMGKNIRPILSEILGKYRAERYFNYYLITQLRFKQVDLNIYHVVLNKPYVSVSDKSKAYNTYIRAIIENQTPQL